MIRQLEPEDIESVMRLWLEGNKEAHAFVPIAYWEKSYEPVKRAISQAEVLVHQPGAGQNIDGFLGLQDGYIAGLFVDRDARSHGVGKELLDHAKTANPQLTLNVYRDNTQAVLFYLREGFSLRHEGLDD